ncbi:hydroquinone glucosyltransferase-like [Salvia hispanica]|uniref:hydroquinone glucosyltransferase-like n=1 Tax=Salvia hispanica TaxID=49212 RepID=UPI00200982B5|nr:hydroquinone glucosyltransferase-like [Salvia hispanica]
MEARHNIALLPPPGFLGHLIPFIELAKKLVFNHNCTITLIIPDYGDGSPVTLQSSLLQGIPAAITPVFLPPVSTADLPDDANPEILLQARLVRSLPALRDILSRLRESGAPARALVVDLFAPDAIDVAREFGIPAYVFYVVAAIDALLSLTLPELNSSCTFRNDIKQAEPVKLPGSLTLEVKDFPDTFTDCRVHKCAMDLREMYLSADAILVNTFYELEPDAFRHLERRRPGIPQVVPVGPLIRWIDNSESDRSSAYLKWLDNQPRNSVLFVSFGSGGTLSVEQITELAVGLEISEQRFLWVVRSPQENAAAAYLKVGGRDPRDPLAFLPEGFLERTQGRGLAVASWVSQIQVLSHSSTGGFLTHCGWNSILESTVHGVPLIAWPICFEQKLNATVVADGLKGGIRVRENEKGIVEREEISCAVKQLMGGEEGIKIRNKISQLKIAAENAIGKDGSSTKALVQIVKSWSASK